MKEESKTTTFMSFLKDSVSRFTQEKQVDQRMESLMRRLKGKYLELGSKVYRDDASKEDLSLYELRLDDISKIDRQIADLSAVNRSVEGTKDLESDKQGENSVVVIEDGEDVGVEEEEKKEE